MSPSVCCVASHRLNSGNHRHTTDKEHLPPSHRRDLLDILEDRYTAAATIVTSQVPVERWHEVIGDPTLADAILDRLVHNAYRLEIKGESMRKLMANSTAA